MRAATRASNPVRRTRPRREATRSGMKKGYYRHPTVHGHRVIFVSEDDLWTVDAQGGPAVRLTSHASVIESPLLAPDGARVAFIAREEGAPEVHLMDAEGGPAERLTFQGANTRIAAWSADGEWIYFATEAQQPLRGHAVLHRVRSAPGRHDVEPVPFGRASAIGFGPNGGIVLGRNVGDPARWKRYKGGTTGQLWLAPGADQPFARLHPALPGNLAAPMWIPTAAAAAGRIYFLSDHEGIGNLYSSWPTGEDLTRHTHHTEFYARFATWGVTPDGGAQIVYHAGADLYRFDLATGATQAIPVAYASPGVQRSRKFAPATAYLEQASLHPKGHSVSLAARGKCFVMGNHEGAALQLGQRQGVRYRLATWLHDGAGLAVVSDELGEERLQVFAPDALDPDDARQKLHADFDFGRAAALYASPVEDKLALVNHRMELWLYDLATETAVQADRSPHGPIDHVAWAPDGRWLAYDYADSPYTARLRLYRLAQPAADDQTEPVSAAVFDLTAPVLRDGCPVFDPKGRYLYFLGARILNPRYDTLKFDLSFARGMRPYLITLQADLPNPFVPRTGEEDDGEDKAKEKATQADKADAGLDSKALPNGGEEAAEAAPEETAAPEPLKVDLEGIQERVLPFPVPEGLYGHLAAIEDRVFWLEHRAAPTLPDPYGETAAAGGHLTAWILADYKKADIASHVETYALSANGKKLLMQIERRLRVMDATATADGLSEEGAPRVTGWLDLDRVKVSVEPHREWQQMFKEAWRLQRDQFWTADMSRVNWQAVFDRYFPLVDRVGSRQEFSDLMWEMQGELGTSHAYEMGGDYRPHPSYPLGSLGATLRWSAEAQGYETLDWVVGDVWEPGVHSPLAEPGVDVQPGDVLIAVNGQPLSRSVTPASLLVNLADQEVRLTFRARPAPEGATEPEPNAPADGARVRHVTVRTLATETPARYRAWVNHNRARVHAQSEGRLGYLHIPDMGPRGFAEFHRGFLAEIRREGLVVDLRFNGGGHVSELLLEQLARKRLGFDLSRWEGVMPYPRESVAGPMVALTNECAGSDGDIFSHCFKLMQLGPLIGKRTWGGVIGIWPRHALVDGTVTTQPEYSFWFRDVGWQVENYGTDPDIEVEITPDDFRQGQDPQLDRAIAECLALLAQNPPLTPDLDARPDLSLPSLLSAAAGDN